MLRAKVVGHARYVVFQMAPVAISKKLFAEILRLNAELRHQPSSIAISAEAAAPGFVPPERWDMITQNLPCLCSSRCYAGKIAISPLRSKLGV